MLITIKAATTTTDDDYLHQRRSECRPSISVISAARPLVGRTSEKARLFSFEQINCNSFLAIFIVDLVNLPSTSAPGRPFWPDK